MLFYSKSDLSMSLTELRFIPIRYNIIYYNEKFISEQINEKSFTTTRWIRKICTKNGEEIFAREKNNQKSFTRKNEEDSCAREKIQENTSHERNEESFTRERKKNTLHGND